MSALHLPSNFVCQREVTTHMGVKVEHRLSESKKGDSFLCHTLCQLTANSWLTSQSHTLYITVLVLVAHVLLRKVTHWSPGMLVCWHTLYVRKVHRKERWCTLIQRSLFSEISKHQKKILYHSHHLTRRETEERTSTDASLNLTP